FFHADGVPIAGRDLAVVTTAHDRGRTTLLLAAVDPVGELVVGDDVVELGGRLVVPGTPGLAAVDGDDRPLIGRDEEDVRIVRADPDGVVVVAAGGAFEADERLPSVDRLIEADVGDIKQVFVLRVDLHLGEIAAAAPDAGLAADSHPG